MYKDDLIHYVRPRKGDLICLQIVIMYKVDLIQYMLGPGRGA